MLFVLSDTTPRDGRDDRRKSLERGTDGATAACDVDDDADDDDAEIGGRSGRSAGAPSDQHLKLAVVPRCCTA